jgi:hypothetical protein
MRVAFPDNFEQMADYFDRSPIKTLYLLPIASRAVSPLPVQTSRVPGNGQLEPQLLSTTLDQLVVQVKDKYEADYTFTETSYIVRQSKGYACINYGLPCNGDNPDTLYANDIEDYVPSSPQDKILIVGVDHVKTNKATYLYHAIVNTINDAGVTGVSDIDLDGSALIMADMTDPSAPDYLIYQNLYAFTISYDCENEPTCLTIPEPTAGSPGVRYGDPLDITGRIYLDPNTNTRPSEDEIIFHRVFFLKKN